MGAHVRARALACGRGRPLVGQLGGAEAHVKALLQVEQEGLRGELLHLDHVGDGTWRLIEELVRHRAPLHERTRPRRRGRAAAPRGDKGRGTPWEKESCRLDDTFGRVFVESNRSFYHPLVESRGVCG